jgi:hypothetical protein
MGWYPAATKIVVLEVSEAPAGENNGNEWGRDRASDLLYRSWAAAVSEPHPQKA